MKNKILNYCLVFTIMLIVSNLFLILEMILDIKCIFLKIKLFKSYNIISIIALVIILLLLICAIIFDKKYKPNEIDSIKKLLIAKALFNDVNGNNKYNITYTTDEYIYKVENNNSKITFKKTKNNKSKHGK